MGTSRGLTSVGNAMRSVLAQVLARGAVWSVFVFSLGDAIVSRSRTAGVVSLAAGAALVLATPLLYTARARAEFAPVRFRKLFLAGATSAVAMATIPGVAAAEVLAQGRVVFGLFLLAITVGLLGAAVGVVRMRAWGVLLGLLTATVLLGASAVMPPLLPVLFVLAAPGALLALPVALARLGLAKEDRAASAALRIEAVAPPARFAADTVEEGDLEAEAALEPVSARRLGR